MDLQARGIPGAARYRSCPKFGSRSCHIPSPLGQWRHSRFQRWSSAPLAMHQLLGITIRFRGRGRSRLGTIRPSRGFFQGFRTAGNRSVQRCNCRTPLAGRTRVVLNDPHRGGRHCCRRFHRVYRLSALARLGLARAYAIQSDTAKAKAAYQDSSRSGRMPTRIFLSSSLQSLSTPSCNSYLNCIRKIGKSGQLLSPVRGHHRSPRTPSRASDRQAIMRLYLH